ncbi:MAG: GNAT family N-acetyltransferase [Candidatus Eremiobacteraeota bacterium]|nr:GNAT family N-acetyltransferase [Candidatus Eremiobacteraeota bacterium]
MKSFEVRTPASPAQSFNLLADLRQSRFTQTAVHRTLEALDARGIRIERYHRTPEELLAWIDEVFGGTWSAEAYLGGICVARQGDRPVGFAAFDARGLRFAWLDAWRSRADVGVFGPFGVVPAARGTGIGPVLLAFAMLSLHERGYTSALIPAVGEPRLIAYYQRETGAHPIEAIDLSHAGRRWRATVLASGNGTNFQAVVDASRVSERALPVEVVALVCNRAQAFVLERAQRAGVPSSLIAWDRTLSREAYDDAVIEVVERTQPELILLLGWMHVLPLRFVARFPEALNVHPAFLPIDPQRDAVTMPDGSVIPAFRGVRAVEEAFAAGATWGGATVHRVEVAVDRGEILARAPLRRGEDETPAAFVERLHSLEHRVLGDAIRRWSYEQDRSMTKPL